MVMWYEGAGNRRGVLSGTAFDKTVREVVEILLFLAGETSASASEIATGVGISQAAADALLASIVEAGGATESEGTYTTVLVEDAQ